MGKGMRELAVVHSPGIRECAQPTATPVYWGPSGVALSALPCRSDPASFVRFTATFRSYPSTPYAPLEKQTIQESVPRGIDGLNISLSCFPKSNRLRSGGIPWRDLRDTSWGQTDGIGDTP